MRDNDGKTLLVATSTWPYVRPMTNEEAHAMDNDSTLAAFRNATKHGIANDAMSQQLPLTDASADARALFLKLHALIDEDVESVTELTQATGNEEAETKAHIATAMLTTALQYVYGIVIDQEIVVENARKYGTHES